MKYSDGNKPVVCMMTQSTCYKGTKKMAVKGVLWHSTGANNTTLRRYVQPDDNAADRDLQMQLDFLWKELMMSYPAVLTVLQNAENVRKASDAVLLWYERPADQSDAVQVKRTGYGEGYLKKFGDSASEKPVFGGMPTVV